jgi:hypothetical protein
MCRTRIAESVAWLPDRNATPLLRIVVRLEIKLMKMFAAALVVAAGLGLSAGAVSAAPVSAPGSDLNVRGLFTPAQYYGGGGYGYRPRCWYVRRCGYGPYGYHCWRERVCR